MLKKMHQLIYVSALFAGVCGMAARSFADRVAAGLPASVETGPLTAVDDPLFTWTFTSANGLVTASGFDLMSKTVYVSSDPDYGSGYIATSGTATVTGSGPDDGSYSLHQLGAIVPNTANWSTSDSGYFYYDNQIYLSSPPGSANQLTLGGLLFTQGGKEINIYSNGPSAGPDPYTLYENNGYNINGTFTLSEDGDMSNIRVMPLPKSGVAGCGLLGLLACGTLVRRRNASRLA